MTDQHPITPPPELWGHWLDQWNNMPVPRPVCLMYVSIQAAQWGADQELEACCEWLVNSLSEDPQEVSQELRAARRPKPPSLKEQALTAMLHLQKAAETNMDTIEAVHIICRALKALPND